MDLGYIERYKHYCSHKELVYFFYGYLKHLEEFREGYVFRAELKYFDVLDRWEGKTVGEFDLLVYDRRKPLKDRTYFYGEGKTNDRSRSKGRHQIERAKKYFKYLGLDLEGIVFTPETDLEEVKEFLEKNT